MTLAYIFIGGGLGAACRWALSLLFKTDVNFPWPTLTVNLLGCFLIGIASYYALKGNQAIQYFGIIGFLGGFTTFSSYGLDLLRLMESGLNRNFILYFLVSNLFGLALVYIGNRLATIVLS